MTTSTLVDTNVLIDALGPSDLEMREWSLFALKRAVDEGTLVFNAVVWAELCKPSLGEQALLRAFAWLRPSLEDLPFEAAYPAGTAHDLYRRRGGRKERTLPDFLIGAHAAIRDYRLLTRDPARYRSYFPRLDIMSPDSLPLEN